MRKISLASLGLFIGICSLLGQKRSEPDTAYIPKPLRFEEANIVTSYYTQNGNHSAVTGGIGTEKLTDISNTFDLRLLKPGKKGQKHFLNLELGLDTYTSASSDKIDTTTRRGGHGGSNLTSASYKDERFYPSLAYQAEGLKYGLSIGGSISYSTEWDYESKGATLNISKTSKNKNSEIGLRVGMYLDTWEVILPAELRPNQGGGGSDEDDDNNEYKPRDSYNAMLTFLQVINKRFQLGLVFEPSYQKGLLATKYQRVYFTDGTALPENLPDQRRKYPFGIRASYFAGDRLILRPFYRYYTDDWGLTAHTISLETAIKVSPVLSLSPFYRYHTQSGIPYFKPYAEAIPGSTYFTADYDLTTLTSHQYGAGLRWTPKYGVLDLKHFHGIELRYAHYTRTPDLRADIVTLGLKFK